MTDVALRTGILSYTRSAKPAAVFNNPGLVLVGTAGVNPAFWWSSLSSLPSEASVSTSLLEFYTAEAIPAGSRTWTLRPCASFKASTLNHNNKPAASTTVSATITTTAALPVGSRIVIDASTIVQAMRAGTLAASGYFQLTVNDSTPRKIRGFAAATNKPGLLVTYTTGTPVPADVIPNGGAVGTRQPIVSWTPWTEETGQQLQLATDPGFTSIVFDSGMVNVTPGQFDLTGNSAGYQLPAAGTHVFGRVQRNGPQGPSGWSSVFETWFTALPVVAITSPGASTGDGTPNYAIGVTGGVGAVRAVRFITRQGGAVLDDSGDKPGTTLTYTPTTGLTVVGQSADLEARATDSEIRQTVRNCPVYGTASKTFQLAETASITPPNDLAVAFNSPGAPWATLTWTWSAVSDEWIVLRDDVEAFRVDGTSVLQTGTGNPCKLIDYAATAFYQHTWKVVPVTNGQRGPASNVVTKTPTIVGVFLVDVDTGAEVQLLGKDEVDASFPSTVFTSTPLGRGWTSVREVDRQAGAFDVKGVIATYDRDAATTFKTLEAIAANVSSRRLRLAYAALNRSVAVHSIAAAPVRAGASKDKKRWTASYTAIAQGRTG